MRAPLSLLVITTSLVSRMRLSGINPHATHQYPNALVPDNRLGLMTCCPTSLTCVESSLTRAYLTDDGGSDQDLLAYLTVSAAVAVLFCLLLLHLVRLSLSLSHSLSLSLSFLSLSFLFSLSFSLTHIFIQLLACS